MNFSPTARRMVLVIFLSSFAFILVAAVYYLVFPGADFTFWGSLYRFALGVLFMSSLNCAKVFVIERMVDRALRMDSPRAAGGFVGVQYLLRLAATGAILWVSHQSPHINLWGAIAGIFTFQIAAHSLKSVGGGTHE
jgi:hypothetical protein